MGKSVDWDRYAEVYDLLLDLPNYRGLQSRVGELLNPSPGMRVLEIGCGTGNTAIALAESRPGISVTSIDTSPAMLGRARMKTSHLSNVAILEMDETKLRFAPVTFDAIATVNAAYMVSDVDATFREWCRVLKPGGRLVVAHPFDNDLSLIFKEFFVTAIKEGDVASLWSFVQNFSGWTELIATNLAIAKLAEGSTYNFLAENQLVDKLNTAGFDVSHTEERYGPTVVVAVAKKR
jgi:ubiquinone/menaquinone biosynthesis C-methylase UbiE